MLESKSKFSPKSKDCSSVEFSFSFDSFISSSEKSNPVFCSESEIFEKSVKLFSWKLFSCEFGGGYPIERREPEQRNKKILDEIKKVTHQDLLTILKNIDQDFLYETVNRQSFKEIFFNNAEDSEIKEYLHNICFKNK